MTPHQLTIAAGLPHQVRAVGNYIRFVEADQDTAILIVRGQVTGTVLRLRPGQGARLPSQEQLWTFTEVAGIAVTGWVMIGDGGFEDDRLSGTVNVIDGGRSITLSGRAFIAASYVSAGAAQWAAAILWNKSTTHRLMLKQLRYEYEAGGGYIPVQRLVNTVAGTTVGTTPVNKDVNGAAPVASEVRELINGGAAIAQIGTFAIDRSLGSWRAVTFEQPICLEPGFGYMLTQNTAGAAQIVAVWDYTEEPIT